MYKLDWALNNLQWLICHKTKPNQTFTGLDHSLMIFQILLVLTLKLQAAGSCAATLENVAPFGHNFSLGILFFLIFAPAPN